LPQGPGHAGQRRQQGAIVGNEFLDLLAHSILSEHWQGLGGHFPQQPSQQLRFDYLLHGRETGEADRGAAALGLHPRKATGHTKGARRLEHGVE